MKKGTRIYGTIWILTLSTLILASAALAGPGGWGRGMGMGPGRHSYASALTAEQSQKVQALRETYLNEVTPLQKQLFTQKSELRLLWSASNPDKDKILAKQKEISGIQEQLQAKATEHQLEIRKIMGQ